MIEEDNAYYLYCLTPSGCALEVHENGVFVWSCGDILAVLSEANREDFCGEGSDARLEDLAWLAPRVFRHEAVVQRIMSQSPVLPARFATLFSSLGSLRSFVREYHDAITAFLAQVANKREWAVKGLLDRPRVAHNAQPPAPQVGDAPGKHYLQRKRLEAEAGELTNRWLRAVCQKAAGELEQRASAFRERQLWSGSESDAAAELILNWAFLVPEGGEADFRRLVTELDERHRARGLSFALSGPWPPYSFAPMLGKQTAGGEETV